MESKFIIVPIELKPGTKQLRVSHVHDREVLPSVLRNRTVLAYLYSNGMWEAKSMTTGWNLWAPTTMPNLEALDWFDIFFTTASPNYAEAEGAMLALRDQAAPFSMQSPVLLLRNTHDPEALKPGFDASLRWLGDRPGIRQAIEATWPLLVES